MEVIYRLIKLNCSQFYFFNCPQSSLIYILLYPSTMQTFQQLGVCPELLYACSNMNYSNPTPIQAQTLPYSLAQRDIIALAQTGSGKTLSFVLPIVQKLLDKPQSYIAIVLSPTRQLCLQIAEHFQALGASIGLKTSVIVGGIDPKLQLKSLNNYPHVVVGTPGRILHHIENTKSFYTDAIKFLVFDEADKLLSLDFQRQINRLLEALPRNRQTMLFSATMTNKVEKLEKASLSNPVRIEVAGKYQLVQGLQQYYQFIPAAEKEFYLYHAILNGGGSQIIVFVTTCMNAIRICLMLRKLGIKTGTVNGRITQPKRIAALNKFKSKEDRVLVATDVASRGLDIPTVDLVINYDMPLNPKDYIHRVGRTARAGKCGKSITFVCQYDVQECLKIEELTGQKMEKFVAGEDEVLSRMGEVQSARRAAQEDLIRKMQKKKAEERENRGERGERKKKIKKQRTSKSLIDI